MIEAALTVSVTPTFACRSAASTLRSAFSATGFWSFAAAYGEQEIRHEAGRRCPITRFKWPVRTIFWHATTRRLSCEVAYSTNRRHLKVRKLMPRGIINPIDKHVGSRVRMRRLMLDMSQTDLGDALGLTFQQVQKYEKGANRIGAARLQHLSQILQVPVPFFFEGAPASISRAAVEESADAPSPSFVSDFLATSDGLDLVRAFTCIGDLGDAKVRRAIVRLVEEIAPDAT
jgi:transcriptional regulator with XRE-family HTH domain